MDRFERAREMIAKGDYDGAMREYEAAAKSSPYDERALCGQALAYMSRGQSQKVIECMADASVTNPGAAYPTPRSTHQTGQALHSMEYAQNLKLDSTCSHEIKCLHNMPLHLQ